MSLSKNSETEKAIREQARKLIVEICDEVTANGRLYYPVRTLFVAVKEKEDG